MCAIKSLGYFAHIYFALRNLRCCSTNWCAWVQSSGALIIIINPRLPN